MRILMWHGYLLRGTGSNIYVANTARSWRQSGHDVLLLCQETDVDQLDFVDLHAAGERYWRRAAQVPVRFAGRLEHEPLGELLPGFDLLVVPSIVPEAFGMVAAEAAA